MTLQGRALATVELLGCFAVEDVNLDLHDLSPAFDLVNFLWSVRQSWGKERTEGFTQASSNET